MGKRLGLTREMVWDFLAAHPLGMDAFALQSNPLATVKQFPLHPFESF